MPAGSTIKHFGWQELFAKLRPLISRGGADAAQQNKELIIGLLKRYVAVPQDYAHYLKFDPREYTKNLVECHGDDCNVIVMCWSEEQSSLFHGHEGSRCFVKVLEGALKEQQVKYPTGSSIPETVAIRERLLRKDDVVYIDDSIGIHKVRNESPNKRAVSLHIYMPSYKKTRIFPQNKIDHTLSLSTSYKDEVSCWSRSYDPFVN